MPTRVNKGFAAVWTIALAVAALSGLTIATVANMPSRSAALAKKPARTDPFNVRPYLSLLGLAPESLAAAGVTAQQAGVVMSNLQSYMDVNGPGLQNAIDTWGTANREADLSRRAVQSSKGTVEDLDTKNQTLSTALAAKQSAFNAAFYAAVADLDSGAVEKLARIHANKEQGGSLPVQYRIVDRTSQQWRKLRDAISQEGVVQRRGHGEELDEFNAAVISDANGDPAVSTAANNVANNLAGIKTAMGVE